MKTRVCFKKRPGELSFAYVSLLSSLNLVLIHGAKLDGYRATWTGFPLCLISKKVNRYFQEINKNKYLTLVPTSKEKIKKYEELWSKIKELIRSITKNSDDYDENCVKIKFNSKLNFIYL